MQPKTNTFVHIYTSVKNTQSHTVTLKCSFIMWPKGGAACIGAERWREEEGEVYRSAVESTVSGKH